MFSLRRPNDRSTSQIAENVLSESIDLISIKYSMLMNSVSEWWESLNFCTSQSIRVFRVMPFFISTLDVAMQQHNQQSISFFSSNVESKNGFQILLFSLLPNYNSQIFDEVLFFCVSHDKNGSSFAWSRNNKIYIINNILKCLQSEELAYEWWWLVIAYTLHVDVGRTCSLFSLIKNSFIFSSFIN